MIYAPPVRKQAAASERHPRADKDMTSGLAGQTIGLQNRPVSKEAMRVEVTWTGCAVTHTEGTFHQLSPYIGKIKSSMASALVKQFTNQGETVYDPFSGCGTFGLEAWAATRHVVANDLNPYAMVLTRAKLFPYSSLDDALGDLGELSKDVATEPNEDLRRVPGWVRQFFHRDTLRETLKWIRVAQRGRRWFLLACMMGILHHQRPGFLSFPSSHTIPYLRLNKFPRHQYPEYYEYRPLESRLRAKVIRAFRRTSELNASITRTCHLESADKLIPSRDVDAILTSPPYMRQLDYGRDNRLRLWFLGCKDWKSLDRIASPREEEFLLLMTRCFDHWRSVLRPNGYCVLVVGDACSRVDRTGLPDAVSRIALRAGYSHVCEHTEAIPNLRRVRRGIAGSSSETVLVLRNDERRQRT